MRHDRHGRGRACNAAMSVRGSNMSTSRMPHELKRTLAASERERGARIHDAPVAVREQHLARVDRAHGHARVVHGAERARELDDVRPQHPLRDTLLRVEAPAGVLLLAWAQVRVGERRRAGVELVHEHNRVLAECARRERLAHADDAGVPDARPGVDRLERRFVLQPVV